MASYEICRTVYDAVVLCRTTQKCTVVRQSTTAHRTKFRRTSHRTRTIYSLWPFRPPYDCILHSYYDFRAMFALACAGACD